MLNVLVILLGAIYVLLCLGLIFIVLLQPAKKGGGLGGIGGGGAAGAISDTLGATQAERTLAKITQYGMMIFFVLSLVLTLLANYAVNANRVKIAPAAAPDSTITVPAAGGTTDAPAAGQTITIPASGGTVGTTDDGQTVDLQQMLIQAAQEEAARQNAAGAPAASAAPEAPAVEAPAALATEAPAAPTTTE
ncbi:MAG: preprotein translocase subunit SecG [Candidatus Sumerlaeia bacterium]|nr:preprotein translocase subunit SecG [Candidatus Sumerlaeia bacterium]